MNDEPTKCFLFEYEFKGSSWVVEFWASNIKDARIRMKLFSTATLLGERDGLLAADETPPKLRLHKEFN